MYHSVAIVGAGAVGASLAAMMLDAGLPVTVVADGERASRMRSRGIAVNGTRYTDRVDDDPRVNGPYELVIVATKSTGLGSALPLVVDAAGRDGVVMSLLNGITSEAIIRAALASADGSSGTGSPGRVVPAMILGIDAVRADGQVTYLNRGTIHFGRDGFTGRSDPGPDDRTLRSVEETLSAAAIPCRRSDTITRTLWWKFMINVGINQCSAVLRAPYGLFQESDEARALMLSAMEEVLDLSDREGTGLTRADIDAWIETLMGLDPGGKTSMLQDIEAGRPTEVDLFAGTAIEIAARHGLEVPVNTTLYRIIRGLERRQAGSGQ